MAPGTGTGMDIDKSGEFMFVEIDDPTTIRTYIFDEETRMGYPDPKKNAVDEGNDTGETQMTKKRLLNHYQSMNLGPKFNGRLLKRSKWLPNQRYRSELD